VQWSGDQTEQVQACSGFQEPFDPRTDSRLQVDLQNDYFELVPNKSGGHSLRQFDKHGKLKFNLWGGEVKLANADVVFYIIDGWYGTIITRSSSYKYGDSATYTGLARNPALSCVRSEGVVNAEDAEGSVNQAKSNVSDVQSQIKREFEQHMDDGNANRGDINGDLQDAKEGAEASVNFACGHVPATNVFDVQWSGDQTEQVQACSGFQEPFDPRTDSRLQVDLQNDYFELVPNKSGGHSLRQFDKHGKLKFNLWGGEVKLANADVVFYIIDGWYGTIITRSSSYKYGDSATYTGLTLNPAVSCVRSKGMVNAADVEEVVYQATSDVNEAQSQ